MRRALEEYLPDRPEFDGFRFRRHNFSSANDLYEYWDENKDRGILRAIDRDVSRANMRGELVWGNEMKDYSGEFISSNIQQRACILCSGNMAGSGKSVLCGNMVEQIRSKTDCYIVIFDSKPEFQYRRNPQADPKWVSKLNDIRQDLPYVKPQGWENMVSVAPDFVVPKDFEGTRIRYDTGEMEWIDLETLFGLREDVQQHAKAANKLNMAAHGISSEEEFMQKIQNGELDEKQISNTHQLLDSFMSGMVKDDMLKKTFQTMLMNRVIGESTHFDITRPLKAGKLVQYITRIASDENQKTKVLAYMSIAIRAITRAREAFVQPGFAQRKQKLEKPVFLYFTEFQTCYPRDPYRPSTKIEINGIYDRYRWMNVGIIGDCSGFSKVDTNALKQSDYILAFKTTGNELRYLQKQLNLSFENEELIANLEADKNNPPFQCALIPQGSGQNEPLQTFYPLPPMSMIQQAQRYE